MEALKKAEHTFYYIPDYGCYHGHTAALAKVHEELGLRGFFKTNRADTDPGTPKLFLSSFRWNVFRRQVPNAGRA